MMDFHVIGSNSIDSLAQDCSNFSALAIELLQSFAKPSIYSGAETGI